MVDDLNKTRLQGVAWNGPASENGVEQEGAVCGDEQNGNLGEHEARFGLHVKGRLMRYKYSIAACARWETPYIAEWLTYHKLIGFDHVFLYCNDDDPAGLHEAVLPFLAGPEPFVTFTHYPYVGAQQAMYLHFLQTHKHTTEWMSFLDIDEFIRLPRHETIGGFVESFKDAPDAIYFNWCLFGNNGFEERPAGSVLTNYTKRCAGYNNYMTKHITRSAAIDPALISRGPMSDFWHYWNCLENFESLKIVNVLGQDMHRYYNSPDHSKSCFEAPGVFEKMLQTGIINHYFFKSKKDFLLRAARGTNGVFEQQEEYKKQYEDGRADRILTSLNQVDDFYLADLWRRFSTNFNTVAIQLDPAKYKNISKGKPALQSSISEWSRGATAAEDAAGAVNGQIDGTQKFHTALEENPWWQVDLCGLMNISEIHIYNVINHVSPRFKHFSLVVSIDGEIWAEIDRKEDDSDVGGSDGKPYIWHGDWPAWGRFVRITLLGMGFLHLDQVEVYTSNPNAAVEIVPVNAPGILPRFRPDLEGDTTVVLTSCSRHDLLEKTLRSFHEFNTYQGIKEIIVVEDGEADPSDICTAYGARLIRVHERKGQLHAIDLGYAEVTTPYIFHCEDDWEFYKPGFIEKSFEILKIDLSCVCVWLRAWNDTNGHPLSFKSPCKTYGLLANGFNDVWNGFTWNPALRRKSDYDIVGPFSEIFNHQRNLDEAKASIIYGNLGYRAVILEEGGYVRHIGWRRHIGG